MKVCCLMVNIIITMCSYEGSVNILEFKNVKLYFVFNFVKIYKRSCNGKSAL